MALELHKRAMGAFENPERREAAIEALKNSGFPMDRVVVATKDNLSDTEMFSPSSEFLEHRTVESLGKGALMGAGLGGFAGLLTGMTMLILTGLDAISVTSPLMTVLGMTGAGSFYGTLGGMIIGTVAGDQLTQKDTKAYNARVSQGQSIVRIDGTDEQIARAESILRDRGIQEWRVYPATENS
ncbi:hypothetical protein [Phormidium sp. CCY1219]|jgi:hypothetical protein|uniref:hypothetical protein n=1 Tax=Phormidium sp. CCY1219 TaxID=2886104 RepID=UPI002D1F0BB9|nr:hypothetical protein [Phormidium sp. CCY1219]MEB3830766.1 hypothetical protein [Phormidium sp. CCY1219]